MSRLLPMPTKPPERMTLQEVIDELRMIAEAMQNGDTISAEHRERRAKLYAIVDAAVRNPNDPAIGENVIPDLSEAAIVTDVDIAREVMERQIDAVADTAPVATEGYRSQWGPRGWHIENFVGIPVAYVRWATKGEKREMFARLNAAPPPACDGWTPEERAELDRLGITVEEVPASWFRDKR